MPHHMCAVSLQGSLCYSLYALTHTLTHTYTHTHAYMHHGPECRHTKHIEQVRAYEQTGQTPTNKTSAETCMVCPLSKHPLHTYIHTQSTDVEDKFTHTNTHARTSERDALPCWPWPPCFASCGPMSPGLLPSSSNLHETTSIQGACGQHLVLHLPSQIAGVSGLQETSSTVVCMQRIGALKHVSTEGQYTVAAAEGGGGALPWSHTPNGSNLSMNLENFACAPMPPMIAQLQMLRNSSTCEAEETHAMMQ
jgi:hypothetical protein